MLLSVCSLTFMNIYELPYNLDNCSKSGRLSRGWILMFSLSCQTKLCNLCMMTFVSLMEKIVEVLKRARCSYFCLLLLLFVTGGFFELRALLLHEMMF